MTQFRKGSRVEWSWGKGKGEGKIVETFTDTVERTIKGQHIKRNASVEEPAYLVEQQDGGHVLKSQSELKKAS
ncbi:DUF2945 domain-containing protein [Pararhizobium gei]|uniref:DUF2945 domain-containing protein n=1 Tax=Pararhizobium gei TaxID=1395951 RepID=UPI0023DB7CBA|nr:DUF2945 domain-containing protein [Rhizobium gei]